MAQNEHNNQIELDASLFQSFGNEEIILCISDLTDDSNQWEAWYELGTLYQEMGELELALKCFKNVVLLEPDNGFGYHCVGIISMDLGQMEQVKANLLKAIELNPERGDFRAALGEFYAAENNPEKALELLELAVEIDREDDFCNSQLAYYLLYFGKASRAMPYIEKAIALGDNDIALFNKAHVHLVLGEAEKAIASYAKSLENYASESQFWADFDADFEIMPQYGISKPYYESLKEKIDKAAFND